MTDIADLAALDFATVTPEEFAGIVKKLSKQEVAALAEDTELRTRVITEVVKRMREQFRPDRVGSLTGMVRWKIVGDPVVVFETSIANGEVTIHEGRTDAAPRVTLSATDYEFLRLVSGNSSPVSMFMTRKLKVAGDIGLASQLPKFFDIPKA